jgi:hypothetical protein
LLKTNFLKRKEDRHEEVFITVPSETLASLENYNVLVD